MLLKVIALLKNPITWIVIGISALNIFVSSLLISNNNLNHKNEDLKQQQAHYEQVIKTQKESIEILKQDRILLDNLEKKSQEVVVKQNNVKQKLDAIPKTSKDRPFSDANLLTAAEQLRQYQLENPDTK